MGELCLLRYPERHHLCAWLQINDLRLAEEGTLSRDSPHDWPALPELSSLTLLRYLSLFLIQGPWRTGLVVCGSGNPGTELGQQ